MSKFFKLKLSDWTKGLLVAVLTAPVTMIQQVLATGSFEFNWKTIFAVGIAGGLGYVIKNLLTNSQGQPLTTEDGKFLGVFSKN